MKIPSDLSKIHWQVARTACPVLCYCYCLSIEQYYTKVYKEHIIINLQCIIIMNQEKMINVILCVDRYIVYLYALDKYKINIAMTDVNNYYSYQRICVLLIKAKGDLPKK